LNFRSRKLLREHNASRFLQELPGLLSIMLLQLMFAGYAAHDLYRSMWFVVGAMAASVSLLPILQQPVTVETPAVLATLDHPPKLDGDWSPALLPALRRQIPAENPPA
jgi:hypothetical protein